MSEMTTYLQEELLDHVFRNNAYTSPPSVHLALFTAAPGEAGGGTELTDSVDGYGRESITFGAPSGTDTTNSNSITFTASGGNWGDITHAAIFDAATAGNMLMYTDISSVTINDGDSVTFGIGDITVSFD